MSQLILIRHGQSIYNQQNLFTGWSDVDLSEQGRAEAKAAGELLLHHKIYPDICFTSWLKRAIHTANIVLQTLEWEHIDAIRSYKLNERHYGAWQGRDKEEVEKEYGEEAFLAVRRGYDVAPPKLKTDDPRVVENDKKYATLPKELLPLSESLQDTKKRVVAYYEATIKPELLKGKKVLISAHGNSLRALVMYLEEISPEDVVNLEIPTGEIYHYAFDEKLHTTTTEVLL